MKAFLTLICSKAADNDDHGINDRTKVIVRTGKEKRPTPKVKTMCSNRGEIIVLVLRLRKSMWVWS